MKKIIAILSTILVLTISSIVFFTSNASNEVGQEVKSNITTIQDVQPEPIEQVTKEPEQVEVTVESIPTDNTVIEKPTSTQASNTLINEAIAVYLSNNPNLDNINHRVDRYFYVMVNMRVNHPEKFMESNYINSVQHCSEIITKYIHDNPNLPLYMVNCW